MSFRSEIGAFVNVGHHSQELENVQTYSDELVGQNPPLDMPCMSLCVPGFFCGLKGDVGQCTKSDAFRVSRSEWDGRSQWRIVQWEIEAFVRWPINRGEAWCQSCWGVCMFWSWSLIELSFSCFD